MKNIIKNIISSTLVFGFFQVPVFSALPTKSLALSPVVTETASVILNSADANDFQIQRTFLGPEVSQTIAEILVDKQVDLITTRKAYANSLGVIKKHEQTIRETARRLGVPEDVAIGVALLENGGSETAVSKAGALGVFQLMPGTARSLGLVVNKKIDERKNPKLNIEKGITYLKANYERFGDWGLATWAYHAGEGNVGKALAIYKKSGGKGIPTIHQLLSNPQVKKFAKKLNDDSAGYPYKVLATAKLFREV